MMKSVTSAYKVDIIMPTFSSFKLFKQCIDSIFLYSKKDFHELVIIDDKNEDTELLNYFDILRKEPNIKIIKNSQNRGFPYTVNQGLKYSPNDVIILNNDTIVTKNWIKKLKQCAYSRDNVATATPLTNNGSFASVPVPYKNNSIPSGLSIYSFSELIEKSTRPHYPAIPTCVGFCTYIRREALNAVGYFDEQRYGRGYEEENDFAMRASAKGFCHLLDDATFIYHIGQQSFRTESDQIRKKHNYEVITKLYPQYETLLKKFDPALSLSPIHDLIYQGLSRHNYRYVIDRIRLKLRTLVKSL